MKCALRPDVVAQVSPRWADLSACVLFVAVGVRKWARHHAVEPVVFADTQGADVVCPHLTRQIADRHVRVGDMHLFPHDLLRSHRWHIRWLSRRSPPVTVREMQRAARWRVVC
jgi:hypothetical protein